MKRRTFIKAGLLTTAALSLPISIGASPERNDVLSAYRNALGGSCEVIPVAKDSRRLAFGLKVFEQDIAQGLAGADIRVHMLDRHRDHFGDNYLPYQGEGTFLESHPLRFYRLDQYGSPLFIEPFEGVDIDISKYPDWSILHGRMAVDSVENIEHGTATHELLFGDKWRTRVYIWSEVTEEPNIKDWWKRGGRVTISRSPIEILQQGNVYIKNR